MDKIKDAAQRLGIITVEDMERYTALELIVMIANKMNEFQEIVNDQNDKIQYLLNEGTLAEVEQIFNEWMEDGTFDTLINQSALKEVNDHIDETNAQLSDNIRHTQGWVNVKSFKCDDGIYVQGDGVHDDTSGIQRALNYCKENKVSRLLIGDGVFLISKPLIVFGSDNTDLSFPNLEIVGNSSKSTIIKKTNDSNLGLNKEWDLSSVIVIASDYLYKYNGQLGDNNWGEVASSVTIKNIALQTTIKNRCGLYFPLASVNIHLDNIEIQGVEIGVHTDHNFYLSTINRVNVGGGLYGINLNTRGIKTSLSITNCFCYGQTSSSYTIRGTYSNMINCCADGCSGSVFDLYFFNGSLISCGSESTSCLKYYNIVNSKCTLLHCSSFHQTNDQGNVIYSQGSHLTIVGGEYGTDIISKTYYIKSIQSNISINNAYFGKTEKSKKFSYDEGTSFVNSLEGYCNSLLTENSEIFYLGNKNNGNKIVFNMKDKKTSKNGTDISWNNNFNKGDILVTYDPIETNSFGMIETSLSGNEKIELGTISSVSSNRLTINKTLKNTNYEAFVGFQIVNQNNNIRGQVTDVFEGNVIQIYSNDGFVEGDTLFIVPPTVNKDKTYRHIPIIIAERTFNRPTKNLFVGLQMFDTTLNKPIWWNGTNWVDSNGTRV